MLLGPMAGTPSSGDAPVSSSRSASPVVGTGSVSKYAVVFLDNQYVFFLPSIGDRLLT